jgi:hypothetical protein
MRKGTSTQRTMAAAGLASLERWQVRRVFSRRGGEEKKERIHREAGR